MAGSVVIKPKREVGLFGATMLMMGCIIGSGIFVSPTSVIHHSGSVGVALIMWLVSGLLMIGVIMCYLELGILFPKAGGEYNFYKELLGDLPAFLVAYLYVIIAAPSFFAMLSLTTASYLIAPFFQSCSMPRDGVILLAAWIFVTVLVVNSTYVRYVTKVQTFFTAIKVIALVIIIIIGCSEIIQGRWGSLESGFQGSSTDPGGYAVAIYSGFFSFGGWQYIFILLEEVKHPEKVLPKASAISMVSVIILYLLTNMGYFAVMTPAEMMQSPAVAVTFAEKTLGRFSVAVPLCVACSTVGALNGSLMGSARLSYAAARDGMFPDIFGTISVKYLTPWISLLFYGCAALIVMSSASAVSIIEHLGFLFSLITMTTIWCVLYLRWKKPDLVRPFKCPIVVAVALFIIMFALAILGLYKQPKENGIGVLILLTGIPVYLLGVKWENKPLYYKNRMYALNTRLQKILMVGVEDMD